MKERTYTTEELNKIEHWKQLIDSHYISFWDLQGQQVEVEIEAIEEAEIFDTYKTMKEQKHPVLKLKGRKKKLLLSAKSNLETMQKLHGPPKNWAGKKIIIFPGKHRGVREMVKIKDVKI